MNPGRILLELNELWVSLAGQPAEGGQGVLRACTMTLFVLADESDDPAGIWEIVAANMPMHPSRAILIRVRRGTERDISARVFAQCWLPFGQRQQICCEQVEISATDASLPDLPGLVLPLAAPDLPVVIWCRCPRLFAAPELPQLAAAAVARKIVVDSAIFGDAPAALRMLDERRNTPPAVADLAWARLTRWREAVSRVFDDPGQCQRLAAVRRLDVGYAGPDAPPEAWYMAAWLADGVARAGADVRSICHPVPTEPAGELDHVELAGEGWQVVLGRTAFLSPPLYAVLGEELGMGERDPVFERILPAAARLAISS